MYDDRTRDHACRRLKDCKLGELFGRSNKNGRFEIAFSIGEAGRSGVPIVILKEAARPCPLPHAWYWPADDEVLSFGTDWLLEPVDQWVSDETSPLQYWNDGTVAVDGKQVFLKLWLGPDDLAPVAMVVELASSKLGHNPNRGTLFGAWKLWQRASDRLDPDKKPLYGFDRDLGTGRDPRMNP